MKKARTAGFRWLPSYYEALRELPDRERLAIYDAILDYGFGNETAELPPFLAGLLCLIRPTLDNSIRFERKQRENGAKGGRPKKAGKAIDEKPDEDPEETQNEIDENPDENPQETQTDSGENLAIDVDIDVDIDSDIESDIESESAFESERECEGIPRAAARHPPHKFPAPVFLSGNAAAVRKPEHDAIGTDAKTVRLPEEADGFPDRVLCDSPAGDLHIAAHHELLPVKPNVGRQGRLRRRVRDRRGPKRIQPRKQRPVEPPDVLQRDSFLLRAALCGGSAGTRPRRACRLDGGPRGMRGRRRRTRRGLRRQHRQGARRRPRCQHGQGGRRCARRRRGGARRPGPRREQRRCRCGCGCRCRPWPRGGRRRRTGTRRGRRRRAWGHDRRRRGSRGFFAARQQEASREDAQGQTQADFSLFLHSFSRLPGVGPDSDRA